MNFFNNLIEDIKNFPSALINGARYIVENWYNVQVPNRLIDHLRGNIAQNDAILTTYLNRFANDNELREQLNRTKEHIFSILPSSFKTGDMVEIFNFNGDNVNLDIASVITLYDAYLDKIKTITNTHIRTNNNSDTVLLGAKAQKAIIGIIIVYFYNLLPNKSDADQKYQQQMYDTIKDNIESIEQLEVKYTKNNDKTKKDKTYFLRRCLGKVAKYLQVDLETIKKVDLEPIKKKNSYDDFVKEYGDYEYIGTYLKNSNIEEYNQDIEQAKQQLKRFFQKEIRKYKPNSDEEKSLQDAIEYIDEAAEEYFLAYCFFKKYRIKTMMENCRKFNNRKTCKIDERLKKEQFDTQDALSFQLLAMAVAIMRHVDRCPTIKFEFKDKYREEYDKNEQAYKLAFGSLLSLNFEEILECCNNNEKNKSLNEVNKISDYGKLNKNMCNVNRKVYNIDDGIDIKVHDNSFSSQTS